MLLVVSLLRGQLRVLLLEMTGEVEDGIAMRSADECLEVVMVD